MRRLSIVLALAILLQACSGLNTSTDTPAATATQASTPTSKPTITIEPSVRPSATIVRIPTWDPYQATATFEIIPILVGGNTITPVPTATVFTLGYGFQSILVSEKKIYWGNCKHNKTKITAQVDNPDDVYSVVIFVRVKSIKKEDYTPWTTGDVMSDHGNGTYSYTLVGSNIEGHNHYRDSWVFFQLVATNEVGEEIGRSLIFTNAISLSPCR